MGREKEGGKESDKRCVRLTSRHWATAFVSGWSPGGRQRQVGMVPAGWSRSPSGKSGSSECGWADRDAGMGPEALLAGHRAGAGAEQVLHRLGVGAFNTCGRRSEALSVQANCYVAPVEPHADEYEAGVPADVAR